MWTNVKNMNAIKIPNCSYSRFFFSLLTLSAPCFFNQLWRLRVTQNALRLPFFFFFSLYVALFLEELANVDICNQDPESFIGHMEKLSCRRPEIFYA